MTVRNLLISGGVAHPFSTTTPLLAAILREAGIGSRISEDPDAALRALAEDPVDLVTLNALRWRMDVPRYAHLRDEHGLSLSENARAALLAHVHGGGGLLALHGASICFDDWPQWRSLLGAVWDWERSSHPPLGKMHVDVVGDHPIVEALGDFRIVDEAYGFLDQEPDVEPLLMSEHGGRRHPLLWARQVGRGRVVYDALGHDERSFTHAVHRTIITRSAQWLLHARRDHELNAGRD